MTGMSDRPDHVAIIGGGPASSTLASLLSREGINVGVFFEPSDAPILVGESLVPGVVPILRTLGIEDRVASFGRRKPGATIRLKDGMNLRFVFEDIPGPHPDYSYNVPRGPFNRALRENARNCGAKYFESRASVRNKGNVLRLSDRSLDHYRSAFDVRPDLIVDATGRSRLLVNQLDLPDYRGSRTDTALFTHFDRLDGTGDGHIYTDVFEYGWCWRIPLPDRCSFGIVADSDYLDGLGESPAEKLRTFIGEHDFLRSVSERAERREPVFEFSNYQWVCEELYGTNWVLLGDAAGFVDPVFSSGLYLGMHGAERLAGVLVGGGVGSLARYEESMLEAYEKWMGIAEDFYSGRLLALFKMGKQISDGAIEDAISPRLREDIGKIFTGLAGESDESFANLKLLLNNTLDGMEPENLRIGTPESFSP